jgi:general secretion pathway protein A
MSEAETRPYIQHRMAVAGLTTALPFNARALHRIHQLARGVPRRINLLCDRALLGAYASGRPMANVAVVDKAAAEVLGKTSSSNRTAPTAPWRAATMLGVGLLLGALLVGTISVAWDMARKPAPNAAVAPTSAATAPGK